MRMARKFNSSSYPMDVYLLTLIDRSFGGSSKNLGVFSSLNKIDDYVQRKYRNRYTIEPIRDGYYLSDSMTSLTLYVRKFKVDEYDGS